MSGEKQTIVEEGTDFKGTLSSSCPIVVRGRIEGEVSTPALTVSENGAVHGRAKVGALKSQGELSGEFDADTVELAGRVKDNTVVRARSLEVKLASTDSKMQVIFGETELAVGDAPIDDQGGGKRKRKGAEDGGGLV
ncbi:MAG TPA: polymer-forming cytoskeletal protein [Polyangiaceae bacterium]|jgi:cytoskeletal protein CcmA (bactofilin family)